MTNERAEIQNFSEITQNRNKSDAYMTDFVAVNVYDVERINIVRSA